MNRSDKEELERYRAKSKRETAYKNQYAKENYRRIICMLPVELSDAFDKAKGDEPTSTYIANLIKNDMRKKNLI